MPETATHAASRLTKQYLVGGTCDSLREVCSSSSASAGITHAVFGERATLCAGEMILPGVPLGCRKTRFLSRYVGSVCLLAGWSSYNSNIYLIGVFATGWRYSNSKLGRCVAEPVPYNVIIFGIRFVFVEKVHAEVVSSRTEIIDTKAYTKVRKMRYADDAQARCEYSLEYGEAIDIFAID